MQRTNRKRRLPCKFSISCIVFTFVCRTILFNVTSLTSTTRHTHFIATTWTIGVMVVDCVAWLTIGNIHSMFSVIPKTKQKKPKRVHLASRHHGIVIWRKIIHLFIRVSIRSIPFTKWNARACMVYIHIHNCTPCWNRRATQALLYSMQCTMNESVSRFQSIAQCKLYSVSVVCVCSNIDHLLLCTITRHIIFINNVFVWRHCRFWLAHSIEHWPNCHFTQKSKRKA